MLTPKPRFHHYVIVLIFIVGLTVFLSVLLQTSSRNVAASVLIGMTILTSSFCVFEMVNIFRHRTKYVPHIFYVVALLGMMGSSIMGTVLIIIPEADVLRNARGINLLLSSLSILVVTRIRQNPSKNS